MQKKLWISLAVTGFLYSSVWAQVPVVDINQTDAGQSVPVVNDPLAGRESLPPEQRLRLLEQQVSNLVQMNLPAKLDALQQQLQQLNGQLEVQAHTIQGLSDQSRNLSQDPKPKAENTSVPGAAPGSSLQDDSAPPPVAVTGFNSEKTASDAASATASVTPADKIAQAQSNIARNAPVTPSAPAVPAVDLAANEKKSYDAALDALSKKHNDEAITAFTAFVKAYPKGTYTPNAHYWLGKLYNMKGKKDLATKEFIIVTKQFPHSSKVPDALLELASLHMDTGKTDQALSELQMLIHKYPHSSAAQQANVELQALKVPSNTEADPE